MVTWTAYLLYRAQLRGFDLEELEKIVRFSVERYHDVETGRWIVVGRHHRDLVMIAYEVDGDIMTPVTVHVTSRQQVSFRVRTGRWLNE